jgi:hypothetical protein
MALADKVRELAVESVKGIKSLKSVEWRETKPDKKTGKTHEFAILSTFGGYMPEEIHREKVDGKNIIYKMRFSVTAQEESASTGNDAPSGDSLI